MTIPRTLGESDLRVCAAGAAAQARCADCAPMWRPGWKSLTGVVSTAHLEYLGALGTEADGERLDEYHPQGTSLWSLDAPIALGWHPYNRCTLWRCSRCAGAFLRYAEYGGYYEEERIRPL